MSDPDKIQATVQLHCRRCDRQFVLPLDDFEDHQRCLFCGAREVTWPADGDSTDASGASDPDA
jgi:hypothetical protein